MRVIKLTEAQYNRAFKSLVSETREYLTESQESKSISAAKKLYMQRTGATEEEADEFVRIKLRADIQNLRDPKGGKFILGATRMFLDRQLADADTIHNFNKVLKYIASDAHINEYDRNLAEESTGKVMSAQELIDRFAVDVKADSDADRERVNSKQYSNQSDYTIVKIDSFEESCEYNEFMNEEDAWCITYDENMWDTYTKGGINQFYFCLKNGLEYVPMKVGEGCPLDEYGLSMFAVSVDPSGDLNTCTCRWNHANGGTDQVMTTEQISEVIGMNFYQTFKGDEKYKKLSDKCKELGIKMKNLDFKEEGFAKFRLNDKWNFIDKEGNLLSPNLWFDSACSFFGGTATVWIDDKEYRIDPNGQLYCKRKKTLSTNNESILRSKINHYVTEAIRNYIR